MKRLVVFPRAVLGLFLGAAAAGCAAESGPPDPLEEAGSEVAGGDGIDSFAGADLLRDTVHQRSRERRSAELAGEPGRPVEGVQGPVPDPWRTRSCPPSSPPPPPGGPAPAGDGSRR